MTDDNEIIHLRIERPLLMNLVRELAARSTDEYAKFALAYVERLEAMREWELAKAKAAGMTDDEIKAKVAGSHAGTIGDSLQPDS